MPFSLPAGASRMRGMSGEEERKRREKGFWDGGGTGHVLSDQSSGRPSGMPGERKPSRVGVRTDIEFPEQQPPSSKPGK
jgi:hypothetical protein